MKNTDFTTYPRRVLSVFTLIMALWLTCQPNVSLAYETSDIPGIDLKDLDADEKRVLMAVLTEQFDPCGKPRSFLDALKDKGSCPIALKLARFVVARVQRGLNKRQIVRALLKELKRLTVRFKFTTAGRPSLGPSKAKVTVIEFSDFQCPHCQAAAKAVPRMIKGKSVRLIYKQYPLSFHKAARPAAIAVIAAHFQGKFKTLHDQLFADQDKLTPKHIDKLVRKVGLDWKRYKSDLKRAEKIVSADHEEGSSAGIDGTPAFFVNGLKVEYEDLKARIKKELSKK